MAITLELQLAPLHVAPWVHVPCSEVITSMCYVVYTMYYAVFAHQHLRNLITSTLAHILQKVATLKIKSTEAATFLGLETGN